MCLLANYSMGSQLARITWGLVTSVNCHCACMHDSASAYVVLYQPSRFNDSAVCHVPATKKYTTNAHFIVIIYKSCGEPLYAVS